jgi:hypothetical protein
MSERFLCPVGAPCRNTLHALEHFSNWVMNSMSEHFTCRNTFHVGSAPHGGTLFILRPEHHVRTLYMSEHFTCRHTLHVGSEPHVGTLFILGRNTMSENFACRNTFHVGSEHHVRNNLGRNTWLEHFQCRNTFHVGSAIHVGRLFTLSRNTELVQFSYWVRTPCRTTLHVATYWVRTPCRKTLPIGTLFMSGRYTMSEHFSYWVRTRCLNTLHVGTPFKHHVGTLSRNTYYVGTICMSGLLYDGWAHSCCFPVSNFIMK